MNFEVRRVDAPTIQNRSARKRLAPRRAASLRIRLFLSLVAIDSVAILASFVMAALIRGTLMSDSNWVAILIMLVPFHIVTAINVHAYTTANLQDPLKAAAKGVQALVFAVIGVIFIAFCLKASETFPRLVVTMGTVLSIFAIAAARYFFVKHMAVAIGGNPFNIVLIRDGDHPIPDGNFSMVIAAEAFFDPDQHDPVMYDRLAKSLESADRVIVVCSSERRLAWSHALKGANVQSEIVVPELEALAPLGIGTHGGMPTILVANGPLGLVDRFVKRGFDLVVTTVAVIVLAPLFAVIALLIKLDSPGPVFFMQTRIGRANQMFKMLKFRSMRVEGCDGAGTRSTSREDDRITRFGRFIRATSIDELPQLINVLRGDMSIVGPRPHALGSRAEDKLFWEVDRRYWHRHAAKPGLTGLAQVRGYRGATLVEADLSNRLQADLEYLDNWSIWRDIQIIAMTFRVLIHRNAF